MLYFLLHDADIFDGRIAPALAASWRRRSFAPLVTLADELRQTVSAFAERFHLVADEQPLLLQLSPAQRFDRRLWRHVAGEVLLHAATDAPPIQSAAETVAALVTAEQREAVRQAHAGSRELEFDGVPYRPGHAGINDVDDVTRLADELSVIDVASWSAEDLPADDADDPAEGLAFAAECLAALRAVYEQAKTNRQVVVCEEI